MTEQIWYNDPASFFSKENWSKFVPTTDMPIPEALNSVVRFTVYFVAIMLLTTGENQYIVIIPIVMGLTVLLQTLFPNGKTLESFKIKTTALSNTKQYTLPTATNPFMNVLLPELKDKPTRPDAAPVTNREVKQQIYKQFQQTSDLYMDTSDLFDQSQAMRTFHTIQSATVPNDLDTFKKFLAKGLDEPDYSSAFPARHGKKGSETYVSAKGSMNGLPSSTTKPTGTSPTSPPATGTAK